MTNSFAKLLIRFLLFWRLLFKTVWNTLCKNIIFLWQCYSLKTLLDNAKFWIYLWLQRTFCKNFSVIIIYIGKFNLWNNNNTYTNIRSWSSAQIDHADVILAIALNQYTPSLLLMSISAKKQHVQDCGCIVCIVIIIILCSLIVKITSKTAWIVL